MVGISRHIEYHMVPEMVPRWEEMDYFIARLEEDSARALRSNVHDGTAVALGGVVIVIVWH